MKRNFFIYLIIPLSLLVVSCGGTSSGGGNIYAGQYDGSFNMTVSTSDWSYSDSIVFRVIIGVDGLVTGSSPGYFSDGTCSGDDKKIYLSGNSVTSSTSNITCRSDALGSCAVTGTSTYVVSSNALSIDFTAIYYCSVGTFNAQGSGYLPKTT